MNGPLRSQPATTTRQMTTVLGRPDARATFDANDVNPRFSFMCASQRGDTDGLRWVRLLRCRRGLVRGLDRSRLLEPQGNRPAQDGPSRSDTPSGKDICRPVNGEVDTADANQDGQEDRQGDHV